MSSALVVKKIKYVKNDFEITCGIMRARSMLVFREKATTYVATSGRDSKPNGECKPDYGDWRRRLN
jgi:hypothetical protein